jgi:hypothetical protein
MSPLLGAFRHSAIHYQPELSPVRVSGLDGMTSVIPFAFQPMESSASIQQPGLRKFICIKEHAYVAQWPLRLKVSYMRRMRAIA